MKSIKHILVFDTHYGNLQELIRNHFRHTGSKHALAMLEDWENTIFFIGNFDTQK